MLLFLLVTAGCTGTAASLGNDAYVVRSNAARLRIRLSNLLLVASAAVVVLYIISCHVPETKSSTF